MAIPSLKTPSHGNLPNVCLMLGFWSCLVSLVLDKHVSCLFILRLLI